MAAQQRADRADHTRLIGVRENQQRAVERRFDGDAVYQYQPQAAVLECGSFHPTLAGVPRQCSGRPRSARRVARMQLHGNQARVIPGSAAARFDELDAALGGNRPRVHRRDAA